MEKEVSIVEKVEIPRYLIKATSLLECRATKRTRTGLIRFSEVFSIICPFFRLNKMEAWDLLLEMEKHNLIEVVPYNGVRIKDLKR